MAFSRERILDALARLPFIDAGELALILGELLAAVYRALSGLLKDGIAGRVSHGTAHLPPTLPNQNFGEPAHPGNPPDLPGRARWLQRQVPVEGRLFLPAR